MEPAFELPHDDCEDFSSFRPCSMCKNDHGKSLVFHFDFAEGERVYGYVRVETGDELSKRAKFAFITWIGESVPALKKAKVSTDKATVKSVIQNFAAEILTGDPDELSYEHVKTVLVKAGGANYGTGKSNH